MSLHRTESRQPAAAPAPAGSTGRARAPGWRLASKAAALSGGRPCATAIRSARRGRRCRGRRRRARRLGAGAGARRAPAPAGLPGTRSSPLPAPAAAERVHRPRRVGCRLLRPRRARGAASTTGTRPAPGPPRPPRHENREEQRRGAGGERRRRDRSCLLPRRAGLPAGRRRLDGKPAARGEALRTDGRSADLRIVAITVAASHHRLEPCLVPEPVAPVRTIEVPLGPCQEWRAGSDFDFRTFDCTEGGGGRQSLIRPEPARRRRGRRGEQDEADLLYPCSRGPHR